MMTPESISDISLKLYQAGVLDMSINPDELLTYIKNLNASQILNIATATAVKEDLINNFFNTTLPCIYNMTMTNNTEKSMISSCFFLSTTGDTTVQSCDIAGMNLTVFSVIVLFSYFCLLILMLCTKRKYIAHWCCWGHPGYVLTINMLDDYRNRLGNTLAFGVTVSTCFNVLFGSYEYVLGNDLAKRLSLLSSYQMVFVKILFAALISLVGTPFLISQRMKNQLIGSFLGLSYSVTWLGLEMYTINASVQKCWEKYKTTKDIIGGIIMVIIDLPKYICLVLLIMKFLVFLTMIITSILLKRRVGKFIGVNLAVDKNWREDYAYKHVSGLLESKPVLKTLDDVKLSGKIKTKLKSKLYTIKPEFKYSIRVLAAVFVATFANYILLGYIIYIYGFLFGIGQENYILQESVKLIVVSKTGISLRDLNYFITCGKISIWLAIGLTVLIFFFIISNSLKWYRIHILRLRQGDWSFLPSSLKLKKFGSHSPANLMVNSMKFSGFVVGYSVWGFLVIFILLLVILLILTTQIFLPIVIHETSFLLKQIVLLWPTILIGIAISVVQKLLARFVFIIDNNTLGVDNRRIYHGASFYFFYFNIFIGLIGSLLRVLYEAVLGVVFFQRLLKSVLPKSYEKWDAGYMSYVGFVLLEHHHANPVLHCFVRLLLEEKGKEFYNDDDIYSAHSATNERKLVSYSALHKKRAINRWHLYIVLSQNPSIQKLRRHRLKSKEISALYAALSDVTSSCQQNDLISNYEESVINNCKTSDQYRSTSSTKESPNWSFSHSNKVIF